MLLVRGCAPPAWLLCGCSLPTPSREGGQWWNRGGAATAGRIQLSAACARSLSPLWTMSTMGFVGRGSRRPRAVTCKCTRTPVVAGGPHSRASDSMVPYEAHHGLEPLQQPSPVLSKVLARSAISISASAQVGLRL